MTCYFISVPQFPYKPSPEALIHICDTWGIPPSSVIMVGDSAKDDVVCGNRAGAVTVLLDSEGRYSSPAGASLLEVSKAGRGRGSAGDCSLGSCGMRQQGKGSNSAAGSEVRSRPAGVALREGEKQAKGAALAGDWARTVCSVCLWGVLSMLKSCSVAW